MRIAIIGAGFCGTTVAVNLLRASPASVGRILLIERVERQIGGVAYSTTSGSHTLNVPAGRMSAFEDEPDDFLNENDEWDVAQSPGNEVAPASLAIDPTTGVPLGQARAQRFEPY